MSLNREFEPWEETVRILTELGGWEQVETGHFGVSNIPQASFAYYGCTGVILQNGHPGSLGHLIADPEYFVDDMVHKLGKPPKSLNGVVIGGSRTEKIREYCEKGLGINITGFYNDNYRFKGKTDPNDRKDIIYIPTLSEVILITKDGPRKYHT